MNSESKTNLQVLNKNQKQAVVSEEKRLLVLAGAGSGKTKTLLQKITYLIEEKNVKPSEILAITFTKNAANEMLDRLIISSDNSSKYQEIITDKYKSKQEKDLERLSYIRKFRWIEGLTVKTFHSFCYLILRNFGVNEFDNKFRIISDEKSKEDDEFSKYQAPETSYEVYHKTLIELCKENNYLLDLKKYILDYVVDKIHTSKFNTNVLVKDGKFYTTLNGTKVRSKSEQFIADWFFRHSIAFEYEPVLNVTDFDFNPDFYIPAANLYIEHISNKSYPTENKERQFKKGNLLFVKTFEYMAQDSALFGNVLDSIVKNRLPEDYHKVVALSYNEEFNKYHADVREFLVQVMRITDMLKVENLDINSVFEKSQKDQHERVRIFYKLAIPIVIKYSEYCINKSYLDFNDMIFRSISLLKNNEDILNKYHKRYKYILVDEFQDVNNLQVELIKLLLTDQTQLFCVGDDWQSIYGFRGSNVNYIIEFEKHFDNSKVIKLNLNYRSSQNIVGASNEVIKHNKFKIDKDIKASKKSEHKIVVYAGNNEEDNINFCIEKIKDLYKEGYTGDDILFLYRRTHMYSPAAYSDKPSYYKRFYQEKLKVQAKTIHAAKGLESKVVFILGLTEGYGGFPDIWLDDRIFQVIKKANHDLLLEEERRLFYVAITRAKDKLFLITEKGNESSFIKEIPQNYTVRTAQLTKPFVEESIICKKCFSRLEKMFTFCPYCGEKSDL